MDRLCRWIGLMSVWASCLYAGNAEPARPLLHPLFCDHAVLQRDVPAPVWGWAEPGVIVTVTFGGQNESGRADLHGKWMVWLKPMSASSEPRVMSVASSTRGSQAEVHDILVGDVWLCSGQSNMEMGISLCNAGADIAAANLPLLRLLTVPKHPATEPRELLDCDWLPCTSDTVQRGAWGGFSAAAFYFGRRLQGELNVPIGPIHSSWGGSLAEAWTSKDGLMALGDFDEGLRRVWDEGKDRERRRAFEAQSKNPNLPTVLYNAMIAPLIPFSIRGVIWYQGEANARANRSAQYRRLLPALIADWRANFGSGEFPFYIVQLAAWQEHFPEPREHPWAELREAQAMTAATVRHSGLVVTIDVGDAQNLHPKDKKTVGERLALVALAKTYGRPIEYSGPTYRSMHVENNRVVIDFDHTEGDLVVRGERLMGFAAAGSDHRFFWAQSEVRGNSVRLWSPDVPQPSAVRYAWDANPECNLYNRAGLPAVPFRTDQPSR